MLPMGISVADTHEDARVTATKWMQAENDALERANDWFAVLDKIQVVLDEVIKGSIRSEELEKNASEAGNYEEATKWANNARYWNKEEEKYKNARDNAREAIRGWLYKADYAGKQARYWSEQAIVLANPGYGIPVIGAHFNMVEELVFKNLDDKERLYGKQNGKCVACKVAFPMRNLEVDHIVSRDKGGSDSPENLQLLCSACNRVKGNRGMEYLMSKLVE